MICNKCGKEMYRDTSMLAKVKRDVITMKCDCGNRVLKGTRTILPKDCYECKNIGVKG